MASVARQTLSAAQYFLNSANAAAQTDLTIFSYNIQAAIVFGRSVTFHLQKEFTGQSEFNAWYGRWQTTMSNDPVCRYFVGKRNYVLKEGHVDFTRSTTVLIAADLTMHGDVGTIVIRGSPWYRRPWRILIEDLVRSLRQWLIQKQKQRAETKLRRATDSTGRTRAVTVIYFEDSPVPDEPAIDLVRQHLDFLEHLVGEAEARWRSILGTS